MTNRSGINEKYWKKRENLSHTTIYYLTSWIQAGEAARNSLSDLITRDTILFSKKRFSKKWMTSSLFIYWFIIGWARWLSGERVTADYELFDSISRSIYQEILQFENRWCVNPVSFGESVKSSVLHLKSVGRVGTIFPSNNYEIEEIVSASIFSDTY